MPLIVSIDDIKIADWTVNLTKQFVEINYAMVASGSSVSFELARFWVTMPAEPIAGRDFQLPASYVQILLNLTNDSKTALKNYWGI